MPLQYSAEHPIVTPFQYGEHHMPAVPMLNLGPELDRLVPFATVVTANVLTSLCNRSSLRMYLYNCCVDRNFNNATFANIVRMVIQAAVYYCHRGFNNRIDEAIQRAAEDVCAGHAGNLYSMHHEFQGRLPPDIVQGAIESSRQLTALTSELSAFARGVPVAPPPAPVYPSVQLPPSSYGVPASTAAIPSFSFGTPASPAPAGVSPTGRFSPSDVVDIKPKETAPGFSFPANEPPAPVNTVAPPPAPNPTLDVTDMNRDQHTLIVFDTIAIDQADTKAKLLRISESLAARDPIDAGTVSETIVFEDGFEDLIHYGRATMVANQNPNPSVRHGFYRIFGYYAKRLSQAVDLSEIAHELLNTNGMLALITRIKGAAATLNMGEETYRESVMKLGFLKELDYTLTEMVNSFLANNLRNQTTIDSFVEDYRSLRELLPAIAGSEALEALSIFERKILRWLGNRRDLLGEISGDPDGPAVESTTGGVWSFILPVPASVTYCPMLASELGLNMKPGEPSVLIDKAKAPVLHALAKSHSGHADAVGVDTLEAWFCTADNRLFRIYSAPQLTTALPGSEAYYIGRHR